MQIDPDVLMLGLEDAYTRLDNARTSESSFVALFEALNWVVAIDDRFREMTGNKGDWLQVAVQMPKPAGAEIQKGIRFARNSVHHKWADAIEWKPATLLTVAPEDIIRGGAWVWKLDIPQPRSQSGQIEYQRSMVGRSSTGTIEQVAGLFAIHHRLIGANRPAWLLTDSGE